MSEFLLSTNLLRQTYISVWQIPRSLQSWNPHGNPDPTAATPLHAQQQVALMERATKEHRAREQNITNDMHAKLTRYLVENLLMINYADSPKHQSRGDSAMVEGWSFSAAGLLVTSHLLILQTMLLTIRCSAHRTWLSIYTGSSVPCENIFSDAGLTDTKCCARLLPENFGAIQTVKGKLQEGAEMPPSTNWCKMGQWRRTDDGWLYCEVRKQKSMVETV